MNSSLTKSMKPLSSVQFHFVVLSICFLKLLILNLRFVPHCTPVLITFIHTTPGTVYGWEICIQLSLKLLFSSPKTALWRTPRWQDLWQTARWQDLQICEMLHFIKTTKACGWGEQRAGVLTAYWFHFLFSVWALLTPPCFKEKCPQKRFVLWDSYLHAQWYPSDLFSHLLEII